MSEKPGPTTSSNMPALCIALGVVAIVALVGAARLTGFDPVQHTNDEIAQSRDVIFEDAANGGVSIIDSNTGAAFREVAPGTNGFMRATMRGLARDRIAKGIGKDVPFRVVRTSTGTIRLVDLATGRVIALDAFGPTNAQVFAQLLVTGAN